MSCPLLSPRAYEPCGAALVCTCGASAHGESDGLDSALIRDAHRASEVESQDGERQKDLPCPQVCCEVGLSLSRLIEIPRVWRRLVLPGGHQVAIRAQEIGVVADADHGVVFRASFGAPERPGFWVATGLLGDRPRSRQRMVEHCDFVINDVLVGLVEVNALLDDGLTILVERNAAGIIGAWILQQASLDFEHVVAAISVL